MLLRMTSVSLSWLRLISSSLGWVSVTRSLRTQLTIVVLLGVVIESGDFLAERAVRVVPEVLLLARLVEVPVLQLYQVGLTLTGAWSFCVSQVCWKGWLRRNILLFYLS